MGLDLTTLTPNNLNFVSVLRLLTESVCTENGAPMVFCANASEQTAYLSNVWNTITLEWRLSNVWYLACAL